MRTDCLGRGVSGETGGRTADGDFVASQNYHDWLGTHPAFSRANSAMGQASGGQTATGTADAMRQLAAAGRPAELALKTALNGPTTPPMRRRLRAAIVANVERQVLRGPLVTLHMVHAPVLVVLQRLCAQSAPDSVLSAFFGPFPPEQITINVRRQPFWRVVARICAESGISPNGYDFYDASGILAFLPGGSIERRTPVSRSGGLLVTLDNMQVYQQIQFCRRNPAGAVNLVIYFKGFWAPGADRIMAAGPVEINTMCDNEGHSMLPNAGGIKMGSRPHPLRVPVNLNQFLGSYACFGFAVDLHWPWQASRGISRISGEIPLTLAIKGL